MQKIQARKKSSMQVVCRHKFKELFSVDSGKGELALLKDVAPGISTPSSEATHLRVYGKHKLYLMRLSLR